MGTAPPSVSGCDMLRPVIRFSHRHVYSDNCSCLIELHSQTIAIIWLSCACTCTDSSVWHIKKWSMLHTLFFGNWIYNHWWWFLYFQMWNITYHLMMTTITLSDIISESQMTSAECEDTQQKVLQGFTCRQVSQRANALTRHIPVLPHLFICGRARTCPVRTQQS